MQGPIHISTGDSDNSSTVVTFSQKGLHAQPTYGGKLDRKGSQTDSEKEICISDGKLLDDFSKDRVRLEDAIEEFLASVPSFLENVRHLI